MRLWHNSLTPCFKEVAERVPDRAVDADRAFRFDHSVLSWHNSIVL